MKIQGLENRCPTDVVLVNETPKYLLFATQDSLVHIELRNLKAIKIHLKGNLLPFKLAYVSSKNCLWMSDIDKNAMWKVVIKRRTAHKICQAQFNFTCPQGVCYHPNLSVIAVCDTSSINILKDNCTLLYVIKLPNGLLAISISTSQQGNYPFNVASDKKMYLMEKNEDIKDNFLFRALQRVVTFFMACP